MNKAVKQRCTTHNRLHWVQANPGNGQLVDAGVQQRPGQTMVPLPKELCAAAEDNVKVFGPARQ
jgi:hypothetical protein